MDEGTWATIEQERLSLADLLAGLTADQWQTRSLCSAWRVRDVAAHLIMTPAGAPSIRTMLLALARTRGDLWGAGRDVAVAYAARSTERIVDEMRGSAGSRTRPIFVNPDNILLDLFVHGQDIAVPLGLRRPVAPSAGAAVLERIWAMGWPFHARRHLAGVRLLAADAPWHRGDGPEVCGTVADLLLLSTGRTQAALPRLCGPGLETINQHAPPGGGKADEAPEPQPSRRSATSDLSPPAQPARDRNRR